MRNTFIDELIYEAEKNERILLLVGDLGYSVIEPFVARFPNRFINVGVAEQNMMGLAAGLASEGYHVFVYSIGNFPTFRCAEQIRNDVDYHNLPVTIVSVGGGLWYGPLGYSHHAVQDYGLMRGFPNMLIAAPGDPMEVRACMRYLFEHPQPSYLRLGKAGEPVFHNAIPNISPGEWVKVYSGEQDNTFLTTGATLQLAMSWLDRDEFAGYSVHTMPLWGLKFKSFTENESVNWSNIITVEDHLVDAGFGSWCAEALLKNNNSHRLTIRGLNHDIFGKVGSQKFLNDIGGLG